MSRGGPVTARVDRVRRGHRGASSRHAGQDLRGPRRHRRRPPREPSSCATSGPRLRGDPSRSPAFDGTVKSRLHRARAALRDALQRGWMGCSRNDRRRARDLLLPAYRPRLPGRPARGVRATSGLARSGERSTRAFSEMGPSPTSAPRPRRPAWRSRGQGPRTRSLPGVQRRSPQALRRGSTTPTAGRARQGSAARAHRHAASSGWWVAYVAMTMVSVDRGRPTPTRRLRGSPTPRRAPPRS